jgi:formylglycine-generating enzyme required for sulfatase activity
LAWTTGSLAASVLAFVACGRSGGVPCDANAIDATVLACLPSTCDGCCDGRGKCQPGSQPSACGTGGLECVDCSALNGSCREMTCSPTLPCNAATCGGCCDERGMCLSGTFAEACGGGGATCVHCGGQACLEGRCGPGCVDRDHDGYGTGCSLGEDCDDLAPGIIGSCATGSACPDGFIEIPAGPFLFGCEDGSPLECFEYDVPLDQMSLTSYCIQQTEVAVGDFVRCQESGYCSPTPAWILVQDSTSLAPCTWNPRTGDHLLDHPVNCMEWSMAREYCRVWVGGDLPSEWQWEKAARGTDGRPFPWGTELPDCDRCNSYSCLGGDMVAFTWPVGYLDTTAGDSPFGLKDMCGNVMEMTRSSLERVGEDVSTEDGVYDQAVVRGGDGRTHWGPEHVAIFSTYERAMLPSPTPHAISASWGFRCVRESQPTQ